MNEEITAPTSQNRFKLTNQLLATLTVCCSIAAVVNLYLDKGFILDVPLRILGIFSYFAYAYLVSRVCRYLSFYSDRKIPVWLPVLILTNPVVENFTYFLSIRYISPEVFNPIISMVSIMAELYVVYIVVQVFNRVDFQGTTSRRQTGAPPVLDTAPVAANTGAGPAEQNVLGTGNSILDKVIRVIIDRVNTSKSTINITFYTILIIVVFGVSFSVGTVALNELSRIRELESTRIDMLKISNKLTTTVGNDTTKLADLKRDIQDLVSQKYGAENSYEKTLANIEKQTSVSWPDIAMRVTIAALTLFLVQIFFNIYKYNQQQVAALLTKAETLELYRADGANQEELRKGLLDKLENNPGFDKNPTSPSEQIINLFGKAKD